MSAMWDSNSVSGSINWSDLVTTTSTDDYYTVSTLYTDPSEDTLPDSYTEEEYKQFLKENGIEEI